MGHGFSKSTIVGTSLRPPCLHETGQPISRLGLRLEISTCDGSQKLLHIYPETVAHWVCYVEISEDKKRAPAGRPTKKLSFSLEDQLSPKFKAPYTNAISVNVSCECITTVGVE